MLPRAAFRALRARPAIVVPRTVSIASTSKWSRSYADTKKPDRDHTWKPSDPIKFQESKIVHPQEQPEFETSASPESNTEPTSQPGPRARSAARSGAQEDHTTEQTEFSGPKSEEENTAPTTDAPASQEPQKPLPDLRYGIPSTFGQEYEAASGGRKHEHNPNNITEDPDKEPAPGGFGEHKTGELPKSAYETSTDRRRNRIANWGYASTLAFGVVGALYLGRDWESEEERNAHPDAPAGWSPGAIYARARARLSSQMGYYTEPTFPKLLPDIDPAPPMTLVLSLEDLLVHSEWTAKHGWRTAKRPGVDYFLRYLSQYYELVIFTTVRSTDADPIIRKLDPFRIVMWPLFREATRYEKGEYIKDLSYLNRDLSKTIIIDTDPAHVKLQPENAIILPKWKGDPRDKGLVALIPFLEYLAMMGVPDVRQAIKSFEGKDIATEFALREARAREEFQKELEARKSKKPKFSAGNAIMGALGLKGQPTGMTLGDGHSVSEGLEQGKMLSDQFRERGQKQYEAMEKEIRENGERWLKEMAEEEKKFMEEQMKGMKQGMFGFLTGGGAGAAAQGAQEKK
ncbi:NIF-domain-containing protein [Westerdykella ornata]|uniref:Mitochondrial import inner membrane translocase subunit TIM50 n=1 Tax=Westerdykella ornata TaxID=318751 RepID=A0A6A6JCJ4_WESOR|nr:NIF-domain-containing protein [Westerdykella ornata]KAF2274340.1 NIF-domain-containing protein [Westerdykella ornata]